MNFLTFDTFMEYSFFLLAGFGVEWSSRYRGFWSFERWFGYVGVSLASILTDMSSGDFMFPKRHLLFHTGLGLGNVAFDMIECEYVDVCQRRTRHR